MSESVGASHAEFDDLALIILLAVDLLLSCFFVVQPCRKRNQFAVGALDLLRNWDGDAR